MGTWWQGVWEDFSSPPEASEVVRIIVRLLMAGACGGILGWDRERTGKSAGLRTHMLVSLGSAAFVLVSQQYGMSKSDLSRVIQGIATGIGFLGGGVIVKRAHHRSVRGLTTAAGIWLTSSIGIAAGLGRLVGAITITIVGFLILTMFRRLEVDLATKPRHHHHDGEPPPAPPAAGT